MGYLKNLGTESESANPIAQISKVVNEEGDTTKALLFTILLAHLYLGLAFFFIVATFHGNITVGQRFATFTFYAMKENETLFNSFLAN